MEKQTKTEVESGRLDPVWIFRLPSPAPAGHRIGRWVLGRTIIVVDREELDQLIVDSQVLLVLVVVAEVVARRAH